MSVRACSYGVARASGLTSALAPRGDDEMFSVIISEKGGAERRETFDRTEINVGRVQGNDLMLPKGNVSKRHARLLFRDGRFIVTDLKSTNGTYVNGRKIAQATIVREGDKIYIGDFVLRIETAAAGTAPPDSTAPPARVPEETGTGDPAHLADRAPPSAEKGLHRSAPLPLINEKGEPSRTSQGVISHFPLENDPDESADAAAPVPGPPRIPSPRPPIVPGAQGGAYAPPLPVPPATPNASPARDGRAAVNTVHPTTQMARPYPTATPLPGQGGASAAAPPQGAANIAVHPSVVPIPSRRAIPPVSDRVDRGQGDSAQAVAHRRALGRLVERLGDKVDLAPLDSGAPPDGALAQRIEQAIAAGAEAMRAAGELPSEIDAEALMADAHRELLTLGPLDRLLDDAEVGEIQVFRHDHVIAMHGRRRAITEVGFSSERAVDRAIRRLCVMAGQPLEGGASFVERTLPKGRRLFAVLPPAATSTLVIRKPQRPDVTLEDLVRNGTISRAMAGLLSQCVLGRGNLLVTGTRDAGTGWLLGALAAAAQPDDRFVVLQDEDELALDQPNTLSIALGSTTAERTRAVQAAVRIRPERVVVSSFSGHVAAEIVDAIGGGMDGVLAAARAPTLRQAVTRLPADIAATRPGITPEAAREWLASSFDLAIEIALLRDGRHRVLRMAELAVENGQIAIRDVFTFVVERTAAGGALEGTFHPSGLVPDIVEDLQSRGLTVDTSTSFRRNR
ncbi:ATPase, T2SS/T4P/T4SS family [Sorangium sp. So ce1014]|uniref:ATPase, T2SS/T4P/T4SS family n=1 Tax=Sorangium sp. So ce1014 TaxID=3133326 RepID=UPI003F60EFDF